jgi:hypothetical protein
MVNVLGTEERDKNSFSNYTIYIVEILIGKYTYKIFIRYSEMVKFEKNLSKLLRND